MVTRKDGFKITFRSAKAKVTKHLQKFGDDLKILSGENMNQKV